MNAAQAPRLKIVSMVREADGTLTVEIEAADGNISRLAGCHLVTQSMSTDLAEIEDDRAPVPPLRN
jgi:hypothetical protein